MTKDFAWKAVAVVAAYALPLAGCSTQGSSMQPGDAGDAAVDTGAGGDASAPVFGGSRPVTVRVPSGYEPTKPTPLVMMLHGYGSSPQLTELYFKMSSIADAAGFLYVAPLGTQDPSGARFWNATDACCDLYGSGVDDDGYLTSLVAEIAGTYNVDPKRTYVIGHSNGAFMAHRLACNHADVFAAAVSFAGAVWADATKCAPSAPVGVLQIHGTADTEVFYAGTLPDGGMSDAGLGPDAGPLAPYPGAVQSVAIWAGKNGCSPMLVDTGMTLHVDSDLTGMETTVSQHDGCASNGAAELWTVQGGTHVFLFTPDSLQQIWQFMQSHAKP